MKFYQSDDIVADIVISPFEVLLKIMFNILKWIAVKIYEFVRPRIIKKFSGKVRITDFKRFWLLRERNQNNDVREYGEFPFEALSGVARRKSRIPHSQLQAIVR